MGWVLISVVMLGWVLVGVVAFLGCQVVLSPVVFGCLPLCEGGCWLAELVLSPVVSGCLPSCGDGCWLVW